MTDPELRELVEARFPKSKDCLSVQDGCLRYTNHWSLWARICFAVTTVAFFVLLFLPQVTDKGILSLTAFGYLFSFGFVAPWNFGKSMEIGPHGIKIMKSNRILAETKWNQVHRVLITGLENQNAILQDHERRTLLKFTVPRPDPFNGTTSRKEFLSWAMENFVPNSPPILLDKSLILKIPEKQKKYVSALNWIGISSLPVTLILFYTLTFLNALTLENISALGTIAAISFLACIVCSLLQIDLSRKDLKEYGVRPVVYSVGNTTLARIEKSGKLASEYAFFAYHRSVHQIGYGGLSEGFAKFLKYFSIGAAVFVVLVILSQGRGFLDTFLIISTVTAMFLTPTVILSRERKSKGYQSFQDGLSDRLEFQNGQLLIHHNGETLPATAYTFTDPKKFKDSFKWPHQSLVVETEKGTHYYNSAYLVKLSDQELLEYLPEEFLD